MFSESGTASVMLPKQARGTFRKRRVIARDFQFFYDSMSRIVISHPRPSRNPRKSLLFLFGTCLCLRMAREIMYNKTFSTSCRPSLNNAHQKVNTPFCRHTQPCTIFLFSDLGPEKCCFDHSRKKGSCSVAILHLRFYRLQIAVLKRR